MQLDGGFVFVRLSRPCFSSQQQQPQPAIKVLTCSSKGVALRYGIPNHDSRKDTQSLWMGSR